MSSSQVRAGIRKKRSLRLGRRVAQFSVGEDQELFTIHENLVCVSTFFRNILQPKRKAIEGDCSICHEVLDAETKELTYCATSCGGNFHRACIEEWADHRIVAKCPLCRQKWKTEAISSSVVHRLPNLDSKTFEIYFEWLYTTHVPFDEDENNTPLEMIEAYILGVILENDEFCEDVLRVFVDFCINADFTPRVESIKLAYNSIAGWGRLRTFLLRFHANLPEPSFNIVMEQWDSYPDAFRSDLMKTLVARRGEETVPWESDAMQAALFPLESSDEEDEDSGTESADELAWMAQSRG